MGDLSLTRDERNGAGRITLTRRGERLGTLDFRRGDDRVVRINYVEVAPRVRGEGHGRALVQAAVDWARADGLRLVPICGYARRVLTSDPAFKDVL
jgi:predicted GNAT family acetyltransferase